MIGSVVDLVEEHVELGGSQYGDTLFHHAAEGIRHCPYPKDSH